MCEKLGSPKTAPLHMTLRAMGWLKGLIKPWPNSWPLWQPNIIENGMPTFPLCWWPAGLRRNPLHAPCWDGCGETAWGLVGTTRLGVCQEALTLPGPRSWWSKESAAGCWSKAKEKLWCTSQENHFESGDLASVHNPQRMKGRYPKLDNEWMGPCRVVERLGGVVYRVRLTPRGRRVPAHQDRLAPGQPGFYL